MSINFNKPRTQTFFEDRFNLPEDKEDFIHYELSQDDSLDLKQRLADDAKDFLYNGIISLTESLDAICHQRFSWATVKLYYSVYYLLRSRLAAHGVAIVWCNRIYRISAEELQSPVPGKRSQNSTHAGTIMHYEEIFAETDRLLSNMIGDHTVYQWIKQAREIVNYKNVAFAEPGCLNIWRLFSGLAISELVATVLDLQQEEYIKCFQEEYAILGIPLKCLQQTIQEFEIQHMALSFSQARLEHLATIADKTLLDQILPKATLPPDT